MNSFRQAIKGSQERSFQEQQRQNPGATTGYLEKISNVVGANTRKTAVISNTTNYEALSDFLTKVKSDGNNDGFAFVHKDQKGSRSPKIVTNPRAAGAPMVSTSSGKLAATVGDNEMIMLDAVYMNSSSNAPVIIGAITTAIPPDTTISSPEMPVSSTERDSIDPDTGQRLGELSSKTLNNESIINESTFNDQKIQSDIFSEGPVKQDAKTAQGTNARTGSSRAIVNAAITNFVNMFSPKL